jgi:GTPase
MATRFLDTARIKVTAGRGGDGCHSFHKYVYQRHKRPDGGHGGDGGNVVLIADPSVVTLMDCAYRKHYKAISGNHGEGNQQQGARGEDARVPVPVGTVVRDAETSHLLRDLDHSEATVIVARGGRGGRGNAKHKDATVGLQGVVRTLALELKLIADIGLVGLPNAGKSSLLTQLSEARPKIAAYPFTTIAPNLGMVAISDVLEPITVCDIPGLITGAHTGRGLGIAFLRHVERTKLLMYVIDMAGTDGRMPGDDLDTVRNELCSYDPLVGRKPFVIAANKMDCPASAAHLEALRARVPGIPVWPISCATGAGLTELVGAAAAALRTVISTTPDTV